MKTLSKAFRYILFVPLSASIISIIYFLFALFWVWVVATLGLLNEKVGLIWFVIIMVLLGIFVVMTMWKWFKVVAAMLMHFVRQISPSPMFGVGFIVLVTFINTGYYIWLSWTSDAFWLSSVFATTFALGLMYAITAGAGHPTREEKIDMQIEEYVKGLREQHDKQ
jgi:hypothetical protein